MKSMLAKKKVPPPLKYHGGKHYLAEWIIGHMPHHTHYVEPYFGGGSVLLQKDPEGVSEVVNDIDGHVTNFWLVLQEPELFERFQRKVEAIPFSQFEWKEADYWLSFYEMNEVDMAASFFVLCRQSHAGRMESFAPITTSRTRRGMNEQASAWMSAVAGLPEVAARLKRVVILNEKANKVIRQQDGPNTLFYLDPTFLPETRTSPGVYQHEMDETDHQDLLLLIKTLKGKVMISGYPSDLYHSELADWRCETKKIDNKASSAKKKRTMTECLWMNF